MKALLTVKHRNKTTLTKRKMSPELKIKRIKLTLETFYKNQAFSFVPNHNLIPSTAKQNVLNR